MHTVCKHTIMALLALFLGVLFSSCTSILTGTIINPAVNNLQKQPDIDLVCEGAPSYLLMIDSLIESSPKNRELLLNGAQAYSGS
ncbi:MAG: TRAP transporter TatT component family protein, partial [Desulfocapsaceae bacterium]|nr:TRAP transporter TatT component family protein [Desulfocapsaceae bacterium]